MAFTIEFESEEAKEKALEELKRIAEESNKKRKKEVTIEEAMKTWQKVYVGNVDEPDEEEVKNGKKKY